MISLLIPTNSITTYPGAYVPAYTVPEPEHTKLLEHRLISDYYIRVKDEPDMIRIELAIPGLERENFHITLKGQQVHIQITTFEQKLGSKGRVPNVHCYFKEFYLPSITDTGYGKAVYENGTLKLFFPKTQSLHLTEVDQLVVY